MKFFEIMRKIKENCVNGRKNEDLGGYAEGS